MRSVQSLVSGCARVDQGCPRHAARDPTIEEIARDPDATPTASPERTLAEARAIRDEGLRACEAAQWLECLQDLDEARQRDPAGDATPDVTKAPALVRAVVERPRGDPK